MSMARQSVVLQDAHFPDVAGPDLVFEFASDGYRQALGGRDVIGRPFREALPEVDSYVKELDLPPEYRYEFLGEAKLIATYKRG